MRILIEAMIIEGEKRTFYAKTRNEWRRWLKKNQATEKNIWLVLYHQTSEKPCIRYDEAVEEALCFGWIDSTAKKRDHESSYRYFAQRKPGSNWSKSNRGRVEQLISKGWMTPTGQALIDLAKKSGTWTALEDVQNSVLPRDLKKALSKNKTAEQHFNAFSPSSKRIILEWIFNAKKTETRNQRIEQTVTLAAKNVKANHYRQ